MSPDAFIGAGNALNDWPGTKDRLNQIGVPTLVIYGDLDAAGLVKASRIMAETIPNASLVVVPQAAHSPQYERPELFNEAVRAHLARNAASAPK
jgi:pimeloyl-ACP methyl ester carboxylesterase